MAFSRGTQLFLAKIGLVASALAVVALIQSQPLGGTLISQAELLVRDASQQLLARVEPDPNVALVDIDEASIEQVGPWPWSRSQIARLVETLIAQGARVVVLDIVLPSPRDAQGDRDLLRLTSEKKLVLAQAFDYVGRDQPIISGSPAGALKTIDQNAPAVPATGIIANHEGFQNAPCVGNIGFIPDADGKLRSIPLLTRWGDQAYPSLALATLLCLNQPVSIDGFNKGIQALGYRRLPESWPSVSAAGVLENINAKNHNSIFRNRIALVGSSALGLSDRVATPLSSNISGMFIHAAALSELAQPRASNIASQWYVAVGLLVTLLIGIVLSVAISTLLQMALVTLLTGGWLAMIFIGAAQTSAAHLTAPLWGIAFLGLTLIPLQWSLARTQARAAARLLSRYVAKPVLRELLRRENFDPLKPRAVRITVLVADMADYSETTATQTLENTAQITRRFLECLTIPVWDLQGTLDRYTGDGLVAFWGAPIESDNQAELAIAATQRILERLVVLNQHFREEGLPPVSARIGIACGDALVGDFGTQFRATYTAVGNCINIAARLESKAKELGLQVLISEEVANQIRGKNLLDMGVHDIRGIGSMRLFTLAAPADPAT